MKKITFFLLLILTISFSSNAQTGAALDFDGTNDRATIASNSSFNVNQFTIETWLKWDGTSAVVAPFVCSNGNENKEIHIGKSSNSLRFIPILGLYVDTTPNTFMPGNWWTHIACVYNPATSLVKIYINGVDMTVIISGASPRNTAISNSTSNFVLGSRHDNSLPFKGALDEFRIWNRALTQAEIQGRMNCEIPSTACGLITNLHFNQGVASASNTAITNITDSSGFSNNATLTNFDLTGSPSNFIATGGVVSGTNCTYIFPEAPTATASQTICGSGTIANLTATGTNLLWYANPTGGEALMTSATLTNNTFYVSQTINGCESASRTAVAVTITIPAAPTANTTQTICESGTISNLSATGTNLLWYANATGGTALATSATLTNNTTYYVSQTINGCESARAEVTVTINAVPVMPGISNSVLDQSSTANLSATFFEYTDSSINSQSFTASISGLLTRITILHDNPYFPVQPTQFFLKVYSGVGANQQQIIGFSSYFSTANTTTVDYDFTGIPVVQGQQYTFELSTQNPTPQNQYVLVTLNNEYSGGNYLEGSAYQDMYFKTFVQPNPKTYVCNNNTVGNIAIDGTNVKWYESEFGGMPMQPTATVTNNTTYYATQTVNGCESERKAVLILIESPIAPTATAIQTFCGSATINELTATGTDLLWYANPSGGARLLPIDSLINNATYYASQTINGCESTSRTAVVVNLLSRPNAPAAAANQSFCARATIASLTAVGTNLRWYSATNGGFELASNTNLVNNSTYYVSQTINGCESERTEVQVIVYQLPVLSVSNPNFCTDVAHKIISVTVLNGETGIFEWTSSNGGIITGATNTASIKIETGGTYNYTFTNANGCVSGGALNSIIYSNATATLSNASFCASNPSKTITASTNAPTETLYFPQGIFDINNWTRSATFGSIANPIISTELGVAETSFRVVGTGSASQNLVFNNDTTITLSFNFRVAQSISSTANAEIFVKFGSQTISIPCNQSGNSVLPTQTFLVRANEILSVGLRNNGATLPSDNIRGIMTININAIQRSGTFAWSTTNGQIVGASNGLEVAIGQSGEYNFTYTSPQGCSTTVTTTATIIDVATPTIASNQTYCSGTTFSQLNVTGTNLQFYNSSLSTAALDLQTIATTGSYYISQTQNGCESLRTVVAVTILPTIAPPTSATQTFCNGAKVADLTATGTNIKWYNALAGGTILSSTMVLTSGVYFVTQTVNGCESERTEATVIVNTIPEPIADATQYICVSGTIANLTARGDTILWYDSAIGGTTLANSTELINNTTYYATQTVNGCVSDRKAILVIVGTIPSAPIAATNQSFSGSATITNLTANGTNIKWYAIAAGGEPLLTSATLTNNTTYYVSQTVNACESASRTAVVVVVNPKPAVDMFYKIDQINNGALASIIAGNAYQTFKPAVSGNLKRLSVYHNNPTGFPIQAATTATVKVYNGVGVSGTLLATATVNVPAGDLEAFYDYNFDSLSVISGQDYTFEMLSNNTFGYNWLFLSSGDSYENGFSSASIAQDLIFKTYFDSDTKTYCNGTTIENLTANGINANWYTNAIGGSSLENSIALTNNTTYFASKTVNGCESERKAVLILIESPIAPTANATQVFCDSDIISNLFAEGDVVLWYSNATGGSALDIYTDLINNSTYYASQIINGCESASRTAVVVNIIATPNAPSAPATQSFCVTGTIADLTATGTNLKWYDTANGGTEIANATNLVNNTTYYVSQIDGGVCESSRTAVRVQINDDSAPVLPAQQSFCGSPTISNFTTNYFSLSWYDTPIGGTALASDTTLINGATYYASKCASTRTPIIAVINSTGTKYVNGAVSASGDGSSWGTAFKTIQEGINASCDSEIWVAAGTYRPTEYSQGCVGCTSITDYTIHLKNNTKLYGGFNGSETNLSQRNIGENQTIITGKLDNQFNDKVSHVLLSVNDNNNTEVNGFIIKDGFANTVSDITVENELIGSANGGGMHNFGSQVVVKNCVFESNYGQVGGGIFNKNSSITASNLVLNNNEAIYGGGIFNGAESIASYFNITLYSNNATALGGGIFNQSSTNPIVFKNIIVRNSFPDSFFNDSANVLVENSNIDGGGYKGTNNSSLDPKFVNIDLLKGVDSKWFTDDDGLQLRNVSPNVNAGTSIGAPQLDILGNPIFGGTKDIGAYERQTPISCDGELTTWNGTS